MGRPARDATILRRLLVALVREFDEHLDGAHGTGTSDAETVRAYQKAYPALTRAAAFLDTEPR